jgi:hypothetical protein
MSEALAPSQPAVSSAKTRAAARSETRLIGLLVAGVGAAGVLVQQVVPPGPAVMTLTALATGAVVIAAAVVLRGRLLDAVSGFRLAAVVLSVLGFSAGVGTLVLQNKPAEFYQANYGLFSNLLHRLTLDGAARAVHRAEAALTFALRLDDVFHSVWFAGLIGILLAGLLASALRRLPLSLHNLGFFSVHLGICVTLAGAALSSVFAIKGRVDLRVGGDPASTVALTRNGVATGEQRPLGAQVQLEKFDVDHYREQLRASLYGPSKDGERMALKASYDNEVGKKHRLPGGASFRIAAYYPDFVLHERAEPSSAGAPALEVREGARHQVLRADKPRFDSADGKVAVLFGWQERPQAPSAGSPHQLRLGDGPATPVHLGETVKFGDLEVKALRYFPQFTYDMDSKTAISLGDEPKNPALEVEIKGRKRWLFARMPGFAHGDENANLIYTLSDRLLGTGGRPEASAPDAQTVVLVGGADRSVVVIEKSGERALPLKDGLEVAGVTLSRLLERAEIVAEPGTASPEQRHPAALIEVNNGGQRAEGLLVANARDVIELGDGNFLTYETRGDEVKSFRSQIGIAGEAVRRSAVVAVNEPVEVAGWKLYQVNYDPKDPTYSGLEAVRDPGVGWVFAGFGLIFAGVIHVFYAAPRLKRRAREA